MEDVLETRRRMALARLDPGDGMGPASRWIMELEKHPFHPFGLCGFCPFSTTKEARNPMAQPMVARTPPLVALRLQHHTSGHQCEILEHGIVEPLTLRCQTH